jgi:hypothetical protein
MIDVGIEDPSSSEGILFCAGSRDDTVQSQCPYDYCVVFEHEEAAQRVRANERAAFAKKLSRHGVSVDDIALILRRQVNTVKRYLK